MEPDGSLWYRPADGVAAGEGFRMARVPAFDHGALDRLCAILKDCGSDSDLTGLLREVGIKDVDVERPTSPWGPSKKQRLYAALSARQQQDRCGNNVIAFIEAAMRPVRFTERRAAFDTLRDALNEVLAFAGATLGEDGRLRPVKAARTLDEAQARASRLRAELVRRNVHADVLRFCQPELLEENYFHAVLEATKSVAEKLRAKTGLTGDGAPLVDDTLGASNGLPRLAFNTLRTDSERSEHTGLASLLRGMFGVFRNPTAHAPKIAWRIDEQDALDLLTLASLLHRRLDAAVVPQRPTA